MNSEGLQESLWQQFFSDPTQWWDNRRGKKSPQHPDLRHTTSISHGWHKPAWVDLGDAGMGRPPGSVSRYGRDGEVRTCSKRCENAQVAEAVDLVNLLVQRGCHLPGNLFYLVLRRCIAQKNLVLGRRIHALSVKSGYQGNALLATHFIGLYASHGRLEDAMRVFSSVATPSAYNWASIISAYARHGVPTEAILLFRKMLESAVKPDNRIFVAVLKACASARDLAAGKDVHAHILAAAGKLDMFVQTCLVNMYAKCGELEHARSVFDRLSQKDLVTWTAMIAGYAQQGMGQEALSLYTSMQEEGMAPPDPVTFVCLLQACASEGVAGLHQGKQLHEQIEERGLEEDVVLGASMVNMYAKCGSLDDARRVFNRLPHKNVVTWTGMIAGYVQQAMGQEALSLYSAMQQDGIAPPDSVTFVSLLQACGGIGVTALHQGEQLHAQIEELGMQADVVVGASLVNMYAKCGSLENARRVFDGLPSRNVVTWTAMIAGYAQQGMGQESLNLYRIMQQEGIASPSSVTFVCLLQACASAGVVALHQGKQLHAQIEGQGLQEDEVVGASLVYMYAKCGSPFDARQVFNRLPQRNVVTWTAMMVCYAQQGMVQEALGLYTSMQQEGITPPGSVTFVCLLQACATVAALPLGKLLHTHIEERGLQADVVVGLSLVHMYAKCGSMVDAQQVFDSLPQRGIAAWNALIAGYTRQGDSDIVFGLLHRMRQEGVHPESITFLSVLTVCSHAGLLDEGGRYFESMCTDYGIIPTMEHYTCMMDLLGRAGHLEKALRMVNAMPSQPDGAVWRTLLAACRKWSHVEVGREAFECALRLDGKDVGAYALMSNIYADCQMWEEAEAMQARRVSSGTRGQTGKSWTDMGGVEKAFVVGDWLFSQNPRMNVANDPEAR